MMVGRIERAVPATLETLDEISRTRPLTSAEEARLARALRTRFGDHKGQKPWTQGDLRRLRRYLQRGKKPAQIAPLMGRTERAIWRRMYKMGLAVRGVGESSMASKPRDVGR